jgi:hypothetical protein
MPDRLMSFSRLTLLTLSDVNPPGDVHSVVDLVPARAISRACRAVSGGGTEFSAPECQNHLSTDIRKTKHPLLAEH